MDGLHRVEHAILLQPLSSLTWWKFNDSRNIPLHGEQLAWSFITLLTLEESIRSPLYGHLSYLTFVNLVFLRYLTWSAHPTSGIISASR